jgi:hypothetical protein
MKVRTVVVLIEIFAVICLSPKNKLPDGLRMQNALVSGWREVIRELALVWR